MKILSDNAVTQQDLCQLRTDTQVANNAVLAEVKRLRWIVYALAAANCVGTILAVSIIATHLK